MSVDGGALLGRLSTIMRYQYLTAGTFIIEGKA